MFCHLCVLGFSLLPGKDLCKMSHVTDETGHVTQRIHHSLESGQRMMTSSPCLQTSGKTCPVHIVHHDFDNLGVYQKLSHSLPVLDDVLQPVPDLPHDVAGVVMHRDLALLQHHLVQPTMGAEEVCFQFCEP